MNYSYSRSQFSRLPQSVAKKLIYRLYQKFSYASNIIDPDINLFSPHEVISHLHICDHWIVIFGIRDISLGFSNTSHVDSLDRFIKSVVDKSKTEVCIKYIYIYIIKKNHMKIQYANEFVQKFGMGDPTTCVYQFICDEIDIGWK